MLRTISSVDQHSDMQTSSRRCVSTNFLLVLLASAFFFLPWLRAAGLSEILRGRVLSLRTVKHLIVTATVRPGGSFWFLSPFLHRPAGQWCSILSVINDGPYRQSYWKLLKKWHEIISPLVPSAIVIWCYPIVCWCHYEWLNVEKIGSWLEMRSLL